MEINISVMTRFDCVQFSGEMSYEEIFNKKAFLFFSFFPPRLYSQNDWFSPFK